MTKTWAEMVKERDGKCLRCGSVEKLEAHHLYSQKNFPTVKNELDCGVTLCRKCHQECHIFMGSKDPATPIAYLHWLSMVEHQDDLSERVATIHRLNKKALEIENYDNLYEFLKMDARRELIQEDIETYESYVEERDENWNGTTFADYIKEPTEKITVEFDHLWYRQVEGWAEFYGLSISEAIMLLVQREIETTSFLWRKVIKNNKKEIDELTEQINEGLSKVNSSDDKKKASSS